MEHRHDQEVNDHDRALVLKEAAGGLMNLFKKVKNKQTEPPSEDEPKAPDVKGQEVALAAPIDIHSVED